MFPNIWVFGGMFLPYTQMLRIVQAGAEPRHGEGKKLRGREAKSLRRLSGDGGRKEEIKEQKLM